MPLPPKRSGVDVFPIENDGQPLFIVRDAEGILEDAVGLPLVVALVWDLLDGKRDVADIQDMIARNAQGLVIPEDIVRQIVAQLDSLLLLDTERLQRRRLEIVDEYARAPARPARFAGRGGYAEGPDELRREIDAFFTGEFGAGLPQGGDGRAPLRGAMAPHIDFRRGGPCYTHAYRRVAEAPPAQIYLVLGVAHASPEPPFVPTAKAYETPLGAAPVDREFMEALLKRTKGAGLDHETTHRTEHSVEFQAVFLRHARRNEAFAIVPILCSAFERYCGQKSPTTAPEIEDYIGALGQTIRDCGRSVCIIAGVDFAHVGPRFGDRERPLDQKLIDWMMEGDKRALAAVAACDAEAFWATVMEDGNERKVCGLSATYTALRLLAGAKGELLRYTYAPDPAGGFVSFAAAVFR